MIKYPVEISMLQNAHYITIGYKMSTRKKSDFVKTYLLFVTESQFIILQKKHFGKYEIVILFVILF